MPRSGPGPVTGCPRNQMLPAVGRRKPPTRYSSVLLPHPLGPTIVTNSWSSIARSMDSTAFTASGPSP